MAFRKKQRGGRRKAKVKRTNVDARPLVQLDLPDQQWKQKLAKCKGAIVKLTVEKTTPDMLETARAALKMAAEYATQKGAVHVVVHPPKVVRAGGEKRKRSVAGLPLRDAVDVYMKQHPCNDAVRKVAERILREAA